MSNRQRASKQRRVPVAVSFGPEDLQTVDDAANQLEQTRSFFVAKAATRAAELILGAKKPRVRKSA